MAVEECPLGAHAPAVDKGGFAGSVAPGDHAVLGTEGSAVHLLSILKGYAQSHLRFPNGRSNATAGSTAGCGPCFRGSHACGCTASFIARTASCPRCGS